MGNQTEMGQRTIVVQYSTPRGDSESCPPPARTVLLSLQENTLSDQLHSYIS